MSYRSTAKGSLRLPFAAWTLFTVTLTAAAGCADVSGQALQQDVAQLRQDLNSLTLAVHRGRGDTDTVVGQLDRRSREQGADSSKQSAALNARLDVLSAEVARVSARVDELSQRVETLGRSTPSGGAAPRSGAPAPSGAAVPPPARGGGASAEESYQAAYLDFSKGLYPLAVSGFRLPAALPGLAPGR